MNDAAVNISQPIVTSRVPECKSFMVDSHLVQNRRVQIMHMDSILDSMHSKIVGRAVCDSSAYTTASQEHGEACVVVVAARFFLVF